MLPLLLLLATSSSAPPAPAQEPAPLACQVSRSVPDTLGRRALANGYAVVVRRDTSEVEWSCIAELRDRAGRLVRADSGFAARVDRSTGLDIDADGTPELVLEMDVGGGNHCCRMFVVVSLREPVRALFEFPMQGATAFRRDDAGRVTLWSWEGGLYRGDGTMANRLFAQRVYRWSGVELVDETPAHCAEIRASQEPPPDADALRRLAAFGARHDSAYGVADAIEELMFQDVFCRDFDQALRKAQALWPAASRSAFITGFRELVVRAYPEYAEAMKGWR